MFALGADQRVGKRMEGQLAADGVPGAAECLRRCGSFATSFDQRIRTIAAAGVRAVFDTADAAQHCCCTASAAERVAGPLVGGCSGAERCAL